MKPYKAPTIETLELDAIDVIATSGGNIGEDTSDYGLNSEGITYTNKGQAWQNSWN